MCCFCHGVITDYIDVCKILKIIHVLGQKKIPLPMGFILQMGGGVWVVKFVRTKWHHHAPPSDRHSDKHLWLICMLTLGRKRHIKRALKRNETMALRGNDSLLKKILRFNYVETR